MRKFIIERDIPGAGSLEREQLRGAAAKSNGVLRDLGPDIQWVGRCQPYNLQGVSKNSGNRGKSPGD